MTDERFSFTVTDLARFLGKSPVTLRGWERKGLIDFPRDPSGDRRFNPDQVMKAAAQAHMLGRISTTRMEAIFHSMNNMIYFELENAKQHERRTNRSARVGQE